MRRFAVEVRLDVSASAFENRNVAFNLLIQRNLFLVSLIPTIAESLKSFPAAKSGEGKYFNNFFVLTLFTVSIN